MDQDIDTAKILLIGEAPGAKEDEYLFDSRTRRLLTVVDPKGQVIMQPKTGGIHQPFAGPSGKKLDEWWSIAGLKRSDFYITNVFPFRPQDNDFRTIPTDLLQRWIDALHIKIAHLPKLNVIVPTGNVALHALTGKSGISDWRGSIMAYTDLNGRRIKVIPTLHPAGWFRDSSIEYFCIADWQRIAGDSAFSELRTVDEKEQHIIHPSKSAIKDFLGFVKREPNHKISIDIENDPKTHLITCIGFGWSDEWAITIPLEDDEYWADEADLNWAWEQVKEVCESENPKILQGGFHDTFYLFKRKGIRVNNWQYDTQAMHHCLEPTAPTKLKPHSLDKMASTLIRTVFWKKDAKDETTKGYKIKSKDDFWRYNAKDCCKTYGLCETLIDKLRDAGKLGLYFSLYQRLFTPLLQLSLKGTRTNDIRRKKQLTHLLVSCYELRDQVERIAGKPLHAAKGFSVQKLSKYLYDELGFTKVGGLTDETTLQKLKAKYGKKVKEYDEKIVGGGKVQSATLTKLESWRKGLEVIKLVSEHREKYQLSTFFDPENIDPDGYLRCKYKFTTNFMRLASSENPFGTGRNLQNFPSAAKNIFIPDSDDQILIELDYSQVESRILDVLTGDAQLIELAHTPPWSFDIHTWNAARILGIPEAEVTKAQRHLAKRVVYASSYGMGPDKLRSILIGDGYDYTVNECAALIKAYMDAMPAIPRWQNKTRIEICQHRKLVNSWGQVFEYKYNQLDSHLFNQCLACRPQSDAGILLNQQGLIPAYEYSQETGWFRVLLTVHDSLLLTARRDKAFEVMEFCRQQMERPRNYYGQELSVFAQAKIGYDWKNMEEFKAPPSKDQFLAIMEGLPK